MGWKNRYVQFGGDTPPTPRTPTQGPVEDQQAQDARTHQVFELDGQRWVRGVNCRCTEYSGDHLG